jgi:hypothetical protein
VTAFGVGHNFDSYNLHFSCGHLQKNLLIP